MLGVRTWVGGDGWTHPDRAKVGPGRGESSVEQEECGKAQCGNMAAVQGPAPGEV